MYIQIYQIIMRVISCALIGFFTMSYQNNFQFVAETASSVKKETPENSQKLGVCGLALHYANVIHQIDNIVSPCPFPHFCFIICTLKCRICLNWIYML